MTAKEALRDRIERFSEDEALEWLARIEWESTETETLSADELAEVLAAEKAIKAGDFVDGEDLFRQLGL
ncbi:MAG: hypothetical protein C0506_01425 [Anaerolinea sp.]|nr:hypothetical protein [Anaerolinea sp.]